MGFMKGSVGNVMMGHAAYIAVMVALWVSVPHAALTDVSRGLIVVGVIGLPH